MRRNYIYLLVAVLVVLTLEVVSAWTVERQIVVNCTSDSLWNIFQDVEHWNEWDPDLESAKLTSRPNETTLEGATGIVNMKFGSSFDFTLHDINPNGFVAYTTPVFGVVLDWYWDYGTVENGMILLKEGVIGRGPLSLLYRIAFASRAGKAFEEALENLKTLCQETRSDQKDFHVQNTN